MKKSVTKTCVVFRVRFKRQPWLACFYMVVGIIMVGCAPYPYISEGELKRIQESKQFIAGKFRNERHLEAFDLSRTWGIAKDYFKNKSPHTFPQNPIPIEILKEDQFDLKDKDTLRFSRLGHSTLLIQLGGKFWLTDPIFSERAFPLQWLGPKRFHPVPMDIERIEEIEAVLISHNHYDHLDEGSIKQLKDRVNHFVVPLGVASKLIDWGVDPAKISQFDWWESITIQDVELIFTPAQHFSGRGINDGNETLWGSWVIRNKSHALYFSGDGGYFSGFKEIGERYGPFDYAFIECGAYNQLWGDVHMLPEDSVRAFNDLRGRVLIPIHNGTFSLSTHSWFDPMERITEIAKKNNVELLIPKFGQLVDVDRKTIYENWWETR